MLDRLKRNFISKAFIRYGLIGITGVLLDFIVYVVLVKLDVHPVIASFISVSLAITNNFILNAWFNFKKKDHLARRFVTFYLVGCVGIIISSVILYVAHDIFGLGPIVSKIISIPLVVAVQFLLNKKYSFGNIDAVINSINTNANKAILVVAAAVVAILTVYAALYTVENWWTAVAPVPFIQVVTTVVLAVTLTIFVGVLGFMAAKGRYRKEVVLYVVLIATFIAGIAYIFLVNGKVSYLVDSQSLLWHASGDSMQNNYIERYPHQIWFESILRLCFNIFGQNNLLPLYMLNLVSILGIIFAVFKITDRIFRKSSVTIIATILTGLSSFLVYYVPFVYGDIIGLALVLLGLWLYIDALDKPRSLKGLCVAVLLFVVGILIKSSLSIIVYALLVHAVLLIVQQKKWRYCTALLATVAAVYISQLGGVALYNARYDTNISGDTTVPKVAWIAMGLQSEAFSTDTPYSVTEGHDVTKVVPAPGVFNGFVWGLPYMDKTSQGMSRISKDYLGKSIESFAKDPVFAAGFFSAKIAYTWADPTYDTRVFVSDSGETVGVTRWGEVMTADAPSLLMWLADDKSKLRSISIRIYDALQLVVYAFAAISFALIARNQKERRTARGASCLALILLIGFVVYLLWETTARYVLPYYILMIPVAAFGLHVLTNRIWLIVKSSTEKLNR